MKLLDQVRNVARLRRLALETERCYVRWIEQYLFSFPGSAWERTALEALPPVRAIREAEPRKQSAPRQSLGAR